VQELSPGFNIFFGYSMPFQLYKICTPRRGTLQHLSQHFRNGSKETCIEHKSWNNYHFFFVDLRGCPGQLARTTINLTAHWTSCKPSGYVRHRRGDRRTHEDSNSGAAGEDKPLPPPDQDPRCNNYHFQRHVMNGKYYFWNFVWTWLYNKKKQ